MNFISSSHPHEIGLPFIKLRDVSGKWNAREENDTLKDISLSAVCGQLTTVVGPVGNGKSSILSAILREIFRSTFLCNCWVDLTKLFF